LREKPLWRAFVNLEMHTDDGQACSLTVWRAARSDLPAQVARVRALKPH
jgi:hypothetical protein